MTDQSFWKAKPYLTTRGLTPENQETPIQFIHSDNIHSKLFYKRNHFSYPGLTYSNAWLPVSGHVDKLLLLNMQNILTLPSKKMKAVLECSGNKRSFFEPKVFGEQWEKGAMSQGYWKGVPLRVILELAGLKKGAKEVVFEGYDVGKRTDSDEITPHARSLPMDKALGQDVLIAYEFCGRPIPYKHGYPLRLIVPQWYAMASVKWLKQITVMDSAFTGLFQTIDYVYYPNKDNDKDAFPVTNMNVNSTIQYPLDREILNTGKHLIKGIAWTGNGSITDVEVSTDAGQSWLKAEFEVTDHKGYEWVSWSFQWHAAEKREYTLMSRATDSNGRIQPMVSFWNRKGYGYNAVDAVKVCKTFFTGIVTQQAHCLCIPQPCITRASTVRISIPTSDTLTKASITIPLSRILSITSARLELSVLFCTLMLCLLSQIALGGVFKIQFVFTITH